MVNKVILVGRLGKPPKIQNFENGSCCTKFTLATNESYTNKEGAWQTMTEWHNIVIWGEAAERAYKQLNMGALIYLEGKLSTRSWKDKNDQLQSITEVKVLSYKLLKEANSEEQKESGVVLNESEEIPFIVKPSDDVIPF